MSWSKKTRVKNKKAKRLPDIVVDFGSYLNFWHRYLKNRIYTPFSTFETAKDVIVGGLYKDRGKKARPILHLGAVGLSFAVVMLGPRLFEQSQVASDERRGNVLAAATEDVSFYTMQAEEVRALRGGEVMTHEIKDEETLEGIAAQYGLQKETVMWENNLKENATLTTGQQLKILPIDGIRHKVAKGETVASIGKKYGLEDAQTQAIVDFPFNNFVNDETFELAPGQYLMIPGGVKPEEKSVTPSATFARTMTPDAGTVNATGSFIWPASGMITQGYSFYHKAIDIANNTSPPILAADSGVVITSGWTSSGYGNHIIIDHGNGSKTLYANLSALSDSEGQSVIRGDVIGIMGTTGRSTGIHLHFEIRQDDVLLNPLSYLK